MIKESKYTNKFLEALCFTLNWEGGYSDHPSDSGGVTSRGITQTTYDDYRTSMKLPLQPVSRMTNEELEYIYYTFYYLPAKCYSLPKQLAIAVFDTAVHSGVRKALIILSNCENDVSNYIDRREAFLRRISKGKNKVFLNGWLNRIKALRIYIKGV